MVYRCLNAAAPQYLSELCALVANVASLRHLRSVCLNGLMVPRHKLSSAGVQRVFRVAAPSVGLEFFGRISA